jgi:copper chaperone
MNGSTSKIHSENPPNSLPKGAKSRIEAAVKAVKGVNAPSVKVLFNSSKVKLDFDEQQVSIEDIENAITKVGYEVQKSKVK